MTTHKALLALAAAAAVTIVAGCSARGAESAPARTPVRVAAAVSGPATPPILTNGVVANKDEMHLSFKVGGVIQAIHVEQGQAVKAGERLADIELTEIDAQLAQARALAAKAQLQTLEPTLLA